MLAPAMSGGRLIPVSPRHSVMLAEEYCHLIDRIPDRDFVVRTLAHRQTGGLPLMSADLVIAGKEARRLHPLADQYPLHFRKTYHPGRLHGDPEVEFQNHQRAAELIGVPPPIGHWPQGFRACFYPGRPYNRLSPFGVEPEEANVAMARELDLATAAGLWKLIEEAFTKVRALHAGGLVHGDLELHNFIICPAPLEVLIIDFENAVRQTQDPGRWEAKCRADLDQLLREAIFLQCRLGRQSGALADTATENLDRLFKAPDRFRREIAFQAEMRQ
ncbi:MAG: hypothetical protein MUE94_09810 [Verrucomicrobia bacterium]|nr:hypothetical protein [Verrucomicrobiota bacterium]